MSSSKADADTAASERLLADAFHDVIAPQTVLIERAFRAGDGRDVNEHGTGVVIGHGKPQGGRHIKIATAGHVLEDVPGATITWRLTRMSRRLDGSLDYARQVFRTSGSLAKTGRFLRPRNYATCDIGYMVIDNVAEDESGSSIGAFLDIDALSPLTVSPRTGFLRPGARVAWAGFPALAHGLTGSYHLCYYEGVVSAAPQQLPVYLIDGNISPGVSGGPLWFCAPSGNPTVVGVVVNYSRDNRDTPGLLGATPLHILLDHLEGRDDHGVEWIGS